MHSRNPIIPGFAPDPSVVRIHDTYYLVNSSFHLFPGLPIFASKDLIAWRHIGNAINRRDQLDLTKSSTSLVSSENGSAETIPATGGLYAPTIRHHKGVIYIVCTNVSYHVRNDGDYRGAKIVFENFVISTTDIGTGHWSDPVYFDFYGIDPDLFFDDDGHVYVSGSSWQTTPGTINCFEIDLKTGRKLTDERVIWEGHTRIIPEGPHIYKRAEYYYLLDAEGGTHEGHCAAICRSQSIWGPYDPCPDNPILKPSSVSAYSQYHGHGDFVQDTCGNWWFVCLGVRRDIAGRMILGRETFLTPVEWPDDKTWPVIKQPISQFLVSGDLASDSVIAKSSASLCDHAMEMVPSPFHAMLDMVWIRQPQMDGTRFEDDGKVVSLLPSKADLWECTEQTVSFVGRRQRRLAGSATASILLNGPLVTPLDQLRAGLAYYKDEHRYAKIFWDSKIDSVVFEIRNRAKSPPISQRKVVPKYDACNGGTDMLHLRIRYRELFIRFEFRVGSYTDDEGWGLCGLIDTLDMSGPDFTGPVIGVFATGVGNEWCTFQNVVI